MMRRNSMDVRESNRRNSSEIMASNRRHSTDTMSINSSKKKLIRQKATEQYQGNGNHTQDRITEIFRP